jgi:RAD51-like protein 2
LLKVISISQIHSNNFVLNFTAYYFSYFFHLELRIPINEAILAKKEIDAAFGWSSQGSSHPSMVTSSQVHPTALELFNSKMNNIRGLVTFVRDLDELFGGDGFPLGEVTEIAGVPGIGKTQFSMQLCLNAQIPTKLNGLGGEAIYIDTEGSMMPLRFEQMAIAIQKHLLTISKKNWSSDIELIDFISTKLSPTEMLRNIHVFRVTDIDEQDATIYNLATFIESHPNVKIVVIDSIAFHYRYHNEHEMKNRGRKLQFIGAELHRIAVLYNIVVLIVNQVTTKVSFDPDGKAKAQSSSVIVPALGDTWAHIPNNRIILKWENGIRIAELLKSSTYKPGMVPFLVSTDGVRGLPRKAFQQQAPVENGKESVIS